MEFQRKYLLKYISIISYVLKVCFNKSKSQVILKNILHDLKVKIFFGLEISYKCLPENILEKLLTESYNSKTILMHSIQIHKCIFVSEDTLNKLKLDNMQWVLVNVITSDSCRNLPMLNYNRIIVLNNFKESECLLTSNNLFNLCNFNQPCEVLMLRIIKPLMDYEPSMSHKALITVMKPVVNNEGIQIILDKVIYNYFSLQKFVSVGDILPIDLYKCCPEVQYLLKPLNSSVIYIKIIQLKGKNIPNYFYNCKSNFYISSLHTKLNEDKSLINTYLPMEKIYAINDLKNLNINNYNDFILNIIPDGMNIEGELLVSWIKPFIQQRNTGDFFLIYLINFNNNTKYLKYIEHRT